MKYYDIKEKLQTLKVFSLQDVYLVDNEFRRATLYDWESQGLVIKLKQNRYVFRDFVPFDLDIYLVANKLYTPSYVSLEMALNHYSIIPESVSTVTSVTTKKTSTFNTKLGSFIYRKIDEPLFFGYQTLNTTSSVVIATLEKCILDYLYLNSEINSLNYFESLRWNKSLLKSTINVSILSKYLSIFNNQALNTRVALFIKYIKS